MTYRVIKYFTDLQDNNFAYNVGDIFPHKGKEVSPSRLAELSGSDNKRGIPLIELVKDEKDSVKAINKPKKVEVKPSETEDIDTDIESESETETIDQEEVKPAPKRGRKPKAE